MQFCKEHVYIFPPVFMCINNLTDQVLVLFSKMNASKIAGLSHPVGKSISGENGPGPPVSVMAELFVHMLPETINIMGWKLRRQLQVLVCKH